MRWVLFGLLSGCALPVAWLNPPMDVSAAAAARDGDGSTTLTGDFEAVALPLNAWEHLADLPVDVGVGLRLHLNRLDARTFIRPTARLTVPLTLWRADRARLTAEVSGGGTFVIQELEADPLASLRILYGVERFVKHRSGGGCGSGTGSFACVGGTFHGAFGLYVFGEGTYLRLGREEVWLASAGLLLRAPAGYGAGLLVFVP